MSSDRPARPWDIFNSHNRVMPPYVAEARLDICKACPELNKATKTCSLCHCIMPIKVTLNNAECPQHKWLKVSFSLTDLNSIEDDGLPRKG